MSGGGGPGGDGPLLAVLLAGGRGTRFWPASRTERPKQFLELAGDRSLLRLTFDRFMPIVSPERILVVTNSSFVDRTLSELPELPSENLILEPSGRDTAPAAALGARVALEREADPVLVVAPTDHYIRDEGAFADALGKAETEARDDALVTFGVVPDRPSTSYGYIEVAEAGVTGRPAPALRFLEKPGAQEAAALLATGRFYWNAGIFVWKACIFQQELAAASPSLSEMLSALPSPSAPPGSPEHDEFLKAWTRVPSISVDYALMERARKVRVVPLAAGWSDVGSWEAAAELLPADAAGNRRAESVMYVGASDCSVHRPAGKGGKSPSAASSRFYALVGTEGIIVVETPDAVLICRKGAGESLREVVRRLEASGRKDLL